MKGKGSVIKFDDYINMVRKWAHLYAKSYHMEYHDLEGQGFLIYNAALETYDITKSKFSTYLYTRLKGRLKDYCEQQKKIENQYDSLDVNVSDESIETFVNMLTARDVFYSLDDLLYFAEDHLTKDAFKILTWVLNRQWEDFYTNTIHTALQNYFNGVKNWKLTRIYKAWDEIGCFWRCGTLLRDYL